MNKFVRYIVIGSKKPIEHGYSTQLGQQKALQYAIDCADHFTMHGRVFGEDVSGSRTLIYAYKETNSKEG